MRKTTRPVGRRFAASVLCAVAAMTFLPAAAGASGYDAETPVVSYAEQGQRESVFYKVTFDANGGRISSESDTEVLAVPIQQNGSLSFMRMPVPVRSGYRFEGWFDARSGGSRVRSIDNVNGNVVLYAQWTQEESSSEPKYVVVTTSSPITAEEVLRKLGEAGEGAWITASADSNEPIADSSYVSTGMVFHPADPSSPTLLVAVKGDILGNGKIGLSQLVSLAEAVQGKRTLTGVYFRAADLNDNGKIDLTDLVKLVNVITGRTR